MRIERERWREQEAPALDPERLVFVDETGAKTNMTRRHGRSPRGQRDAVTAGPRDRRGEPIARPVTGEETARL